MHVSRKRVSYAGTIQKRPAQDTQGEFVELLEETYYCIRNYDALTPFFMTIVSGSNHWLFISTTGGLAAGRINANHALFPYYTVDKITENYNNTGAKSIFVVTTDAAQMIWEPFSNYYRGLYQIERNLYKNVSGTSIVFEEINHDLSLTYRYAWRTSDTYGFVKTAWLINHGSESRTIEFIDGLQNLLPAHTTADVQTELSNLLDAYKFSECHQETGLGLYSLSSRLTDLAEPSESLRATTVWQTGLDTVSHLLSSDQIDRFRLGYPIEAEQSTRGKRGAYFIHTTRTLAPDETLSWHLVAEVEQDSVNVHNLVRLLGDDRDSLYDRVEQDIATNQRNLESIVARADGMQVSNDDLSTVHHFANVLFNVMRGGVFVHHYDIDTQDLHEFVAVHRPELLSSQTAFFASLPERITVSELHDAVEKVDSPDLMRLCSSYLPLTFSRRHGDPSRPWNEFEINVKKDNGSRRLDYQGNWRDIFQNWEALSYAYPEYIDGMINVFLNATTVDGYNPYHVTRNGVNWEIPDPTSAWSNIGYWNDHQIIYLLKLLEVCNSFYPSKLQKQLSRRMFSYANVPYRIKPYDDLLKDPYETIDFDWDAETAIKARVKEEGADAKLVHNNNGQVIHASLGEKLLSLLLSKLVNFVPEGGIWLNTQRPEWNDANNALVGKGLSVVTLGYMRRFIAFFADLLAEIDSLDSIPVSSNLVVLFDAINNILQAHQPALDGPIDDTTRRTIMDQLGQAGSEFRWHYYNNGLDGSVTELPVSTVSSFLKLANAYVEHSLRANKRSDHLYHAYNTLHLSKDAASISHLYEMLEGQVAILSSGLLTPEESLKLLQAMPESKLYRADQHSYTLYPNRDLPGFLEKNVIEAESVRESQLIAALVENQDRRLIRRDMNGHYHFSGDIRNAVEVNQVLDTLSKEPAYTELVDKERDAILDLFEKVFHHAAFTGRSGTFFAYEGLGSIYWHMVSKFLLATQETVLWAQADGAPESTLNALIERYFDIRDGLGFNKSPDAYGAFPTDPYSHTPSGQGAKQPGMTGVVKEEILTRIVELGITIDWGEVVFNPVLLRESELLQTPAALPLLKEDDHQQRSLTVQEGSMAFTFCQVPVVVQKADKNALVVQLNDGTQQHIEGHRLGKDISQEIFARSGHIRLMTILFNEGA